MSRVVVTGMGLETCVGDDLPTFWNALIEGRSGIGPITAFEVPERLPCKIAGEVSDFDPATVLSVTDIRRTSRFQQLLLSAALKARDDALASWTDPYRVAIVVGTGGGGLPLAEDYCGRDRPGPVDRMVVLKTLPNMAAGLAALHLGVQGPNLTISTSCAASTDAFGVASRMVSGGLVDVAFACGVDAYITEITIRNFCAMNVLSTRPPQEASIACRPFDADRDGMVPSEGAGAIVLERLDHARSRGARILAEVAGVASTCDANHLSAPRQDGAAAAFAITAALRDAHCDAREVDHVNAHGTSTRLNDVTETRALKVALGDRAGTIPVTASKSVVGHASGACGAIELAATVLTLKHQVVPPTINLDRPDPECDLAYVTGGPKPAEIRTALKVSFGFGGQNSAVLLRRWDEESDG